MILEIDYKYSRMDNTPLHCAMKWYDASEHIKLLLNKGANMTMKNEMGQTPKDIAAAHLYDKNKGRDK